jgi:hypothetical protein
MARLAVAVWPPPEVVATLSALDELAAVVFEVTEDLVPVTHPQPFGADIVLARGRVPARLAGRPVAARWAARELALVADRSSPHGPRFDDLLTVPLADTGPAAALRS